MAELSELAAKYHLENNLYHGGGLEKVMHQMGESRRRRFCLQNRDFDLDERDKCVKVAEFLENELNGCQKCLLRTKSMQGLGIRPSESKTDNTWKSGRSDRNGGQTGPKTYSSNVDVKKDRAICHTPHRLASDR